MVACVTTAARSIEFGVMSRRVISNLKCLLETGKLIADPPNVKRPNPPRALTLRNETIRLAI